MEIAVPNMNNRNSNRSNESMMYLRTREAAQDNSDSEASAQKFYEVSCEAAQAVLAIFSGPGRVNSTVQYSV